MTTRRDMASNLAVAEFWQEVGGFMIDIGEPSCFACGSWSDGVPDEGPLAERWRSHHLERAHLVDHAYGGSGRPPNLVLLCGPCHRRMPPFDDREAALRWVRNQRSWYSRMLFEYERWSPEDLAAHHAYMSAFLRS